MKRDHHQIARQALREVVRGAGSQKAAAKHLHCSEAYLSDLLRGYRPFSEGMLAKLGLQRIIVARS